MTYIHDGLQKDNPQNYEDRIANLMQGQSSGQYQQNICKEYEDYLRKQGLFLGSMAHHLNYKSSMEYVKQHEEKKLIAQLAYDAMPLWKKILHKLRSWSCTQQS